MMEQKYGKIVNVSARTAVQRGSRARSGAYAVSKAGVVTLTEALAEETRDHGIQVNCIMPSTIDTEANRKMLPKADFTKWVDPEEIAEVILFLVSDASKPTSGASIPVYGRV
jgi:NAD(P)-dependent dehydrogenase (short-subunit alcohol dehydrogenase family)